MTDNNQYPRVYSQFNQMTQSQQPYYYHSQHFFQMPLNHNPIEPPFNPNPPKKERQKELLFNLDEIKNKTSSAKTPKYINSDKTPKYINSDFVEKVKQVKKTETPAVPVVVAAPVVSEKKNTFISKEQIAKNKELLNSPKKTEPVVPKKEVEKPIATEVTKPVVFEKKLPDILQRIRYTREFLLKIKTAKICDELSFKLNLDGKKRINIDLTDVNLTTVEKPFVPSRNEPQNDKTLSFDSSVGIILNQIMPHNIPDTYSQLKKLCGKSAEKYEMLATMLFNCAIKQSKFSHLFAELAKHLKEELPFRKTLVNSCQNMVQRTIEDIVKDANKSVDDELVNITDENTRAVFQDNRDSVVTKFKEKYFGNIKLFAELFKVEIISVNPFQNEFMNLVKTNELSMRNAEAFLIIYSTAENEIEKTISTENLNQFFTKLKRIMDSTKSIESHIRYKIDDVIEKRKTMKKRKEDFSLSNISLMPKDTWGSGIPNPQKTWNKKVQPKDSELNKDYFQLFIDNDLDYETQLVNFKEKKMALNKIVKNSLTDAMEKKADRRVACGKFLAHLYLNKCLNADDLTIGFEEYCKTIDEDWYENYPMGMDFLGSIMAHFVMNVAEKKPEELSIVTAIVNKVPVTTEVDYTYGLEILGMTLLHMNKIIKEGEKENKKIDMPTIPGLMATFEALAKKSQMTDLNEYIDQAKITFVKSINDKQTPPAITTNNAPPTSMKAKIKESTSNQALNVQAMSNQSKTYASKKSMPNNPSKPSSITHQKVNRSVSQKNNNLPTSGVAVNSKINNRPQMDSPSMGRGNKFHDADSTTSQQDGFQRLNNKKGNNKKNPAKNGKGDGTRQKIIEAASRDEIEKVTSLLSELDPEMMDNIEFLNKFTSIIYERALNMDKASMEKTIMILIPVAKANNMGRNYKILMDQLQKFADDKKVKEIFEAMVSRNVLPEESIKEWTKDLPWNENNYEKLRSVVYQVLPDLSS